MAKREVAKPVKYSIGYCEHCNRLVFATADGPDDYKHLGTRRSTCSPVPKASISPLQPRAQVVVTPDRLADIEAVKSVRSRLEYKDNGEVVFREVGSN